MELADISFEVEALDEWKEICNELGMERQVSLTKGKDSPVPYPFLNTTMERVYKTLCPENVDYKKYDKTPIPLPVLKQIQYSVKEKHFQKIEIWYDNKTPCPVVIGFTCKYWKYTKKGYDKVYFDTKELAEELNEILSDDIHSDDISYLIAVWGDELKEFKELKGLAHERLVEKVGNKLQIEQKEIEQKLNILKENCLSFLNGDIDYYSIS